MLFSAAVISLAVDSRTLVIIKRVKWLNQKSNSEMKSLGLSKAARCGGGTAHAAAAANRTGQGPFAAASVHRELGGGSSGVISLSSSFRS